MAEALRIAVTAPIPTNGHALVNNPVSTPLNAMATASPAITARGKRYRHMVRVEVRLRNGTVHEKTVEAPRGSEDHFATREDIVAKFIKLASCRLPRTQAERIASMVMEAEKQPSAAAIVQALAPAA